MNRIPGAPISWGVCLHHGTPLPLDVDAITNMQYIDTAYTAAGMSPR
jgi:hypothetical protein